MPPNEGFKDFIRDQLAGFGPVSMRNMFGGAGIYADGVMFAILKNDILYLKTDEETVRAFEVEGMEPFTYQPAGRAPVAISYWSVPPQLLEDPDELAQWAREAYRIACKSQTAKPARKRRKPSSR